MTTTEAPTIELFSTAAPSTSSHTPTTDAIPTTSSFDFDTSINMPPVMTTTESSVQTTLENHLQVDPTTEYHSTFATVPITEEEIFHPTASVAAANSSTDELVYPTTQHEVEETTTPSTGNNTEYILVHGNDVVTYDVTEDTRSENVTLNPIVPVIPVSVPIDVYTTTTYSPIKTTVVTVKTMVDDITTTHDAEIGHPTTPATRVTLDTVPVVTDTPTIPVVEAHPGDTLNVPTIAEVILPCPTHADLEDVSFRPRRCSFYALKPFMVDWSVSLHFRKCPFKRRVHRTTKYSCRKPHSDVLYLYLNVRNFYIFKLNYIFHVLY